jgi:hypothetical protein
MKHCTLLSVAISILMRLHFNSFHRDGEAATTGESGDGSAATGDDATTGGEGGDLKIKLKLRRKSGDDDDNGGDERKSARGVDDDYVVGDDTESAKVLFSLHLSILCHSVMTLAVLLLNRKKRRKRKRQKRKRSEFEKMVS